MCGISGVISTNVIDQNKLKIYNKFSNLQNHRGPDYQSFKIFEHESILFQHQRLSILDLTSNSNQPIFSKCNNYCIVFNGEIYNYKELSQKFLNYIVDSDTLFIVEALNLFGVKKLVKMFDGMFAIAIYDLKNKEIYLIRDRVGQKPLFYYKNKNILVFSSELQFTKKILEINGISLKYSSKTLNQLLLFGFNQLDATPFIEIKTVKPNNILKFSFGEEIKLIGSSKIYKDINKSMSLITIDNYKNQYEKFKYALISSIEKTVRSDVPFGFFLSSGLDSTTLALLAKKECNIDFPTFTFSDPLSSENESEQALITSKFLKLENYSLTYKLNSIIDIAEKIIENSDIPPVDSSFLPSYLICKKASEKCKVMIGGDGSDELLGGYDRYFNKYSNTLFIQQLLQQIHPKIKKFKPFSKYFSKNIKNTLIPYFSAKTPNEYYLYSNSSKYIRTLAEPFIKSFHNSILNSSFLDIGRLNDFLTYLPQDILIKSDRTSMSSSIELRSPFLSNTLIDQCTGTSFNNKSFKPKQFLLDIINEYGLPYEISQKKGFSIAIEEIYINEKNRYMVEKIHNFWAEFLPQKLLIDILKRIKRKEKMYQLAWRLYSIARWSDYQ